MKQYITNPEQSKPFEGDEPPATYLHPIKLLTYLAKSPDLSPTLDEDELEDEELEDELEDEELPEEGAFVVVRLAFT